MTNLQPQRRTQRLRPFFHHFKSHKLKKWKWEHFCSQKLLFSFQVSFTLDSKRLNCGCLSRVQIAAKYQSQLFALLSFKIRYFHGRFFKKEPRELESNEPGLKMTSFPIFLACSAANWSKWVAKCCHFITVDILESRNIESNVPSDKMTTNFTNFDSFSTKLVKMGSKISQFYYGRFFRI